MFLIFIISIRHEFDTYFYLKFRFDAPKYLKLRFEASTAGRHYTYFCREGGEPKSQW